MNVKELKQLLEQYPDDMEIWISDHGMLEGGERLIKVEKVLASEVGLDGDSINEEWYHVDDDTNISEYLSKGYVLANNGEYVSQEILYLNDYD